MTESSSNLTIRVQEREKEGPLDLQIFFPDPNKDPNGAVALARVELRDAMKSGAARYIFVDDAAHPCTEQVFQEIGRALQGIRVSLAMHGEGMRMTSSFDCGLQLLLDVPSFLVNARDASSAVSAVIEPRRN